MVNFNSTSEVKDKIGRHFRRAFADIRRAKERIRSIVSDTVHFERTHAEYLTELSKLWQADWYKRLPRWAKAEVSGYLDAYSAQLNTGEYGGKLVSCHLYDGKLYRKYEDWRAEWPETDARELSDTCVSAWPSGKVFNGYTGKKDANGMPVPMRVVGQTFEFYKWEKGGKNVTHNSNT